MPQGEAGVGESQPVRGTESGASVRSPRGKQGSKEDLTVRRAHGPRCRLFTDKSRERLFKASKGEIVRRSQSTGLR